MYYMPYLAITLRKAYRPHRIPSIVLHKECVSVLTPCLTKFFQLCLYTSTFPSCWNLAYINPIPKKTGRSNSSNNGPIALISGFPILLLFFFNQSSITRFSNISLQHNFLQNHSVTALLAFLTKSWSLFLKKISETCAFALNTSKAFD